MYYSILKTVRQFLKFTVYMQLLGGNGRTAGERRIGVIVMDDILEHSPAGAAKYMAQILPVLLQAAQDKVRF